MLYIPLINNQTIKQLHKMWQRNETSPSGTQSFIEIFIYILHPDVAFYIERIGFLRSNVPTCSI